MRILFVEDNENLGEMIKSFLQERHYLVEWIKDGLLAKQAVQNEVFDILILDFELPRFSGIEILKYIRKESKLNKSVPILMLTVREELDSRIKGLNNGADDYLVKPCALEELHARLQALYRRRNGIMAPLLKRGGLALDLESGKVTLNEESVYLSRREFEILKKLLENQGRHIHKENLIQLIYGWEKEIDSNSLEVHIHNIRKKLDRIKKNFGTQLIHTVRSIGYTIHTLEGKKEYK